MNVNPYEYYGGVVIIAIAVGFRMHSIPAVFVITGAGAVIGSFLKSCLSITH